MTPTSMLRDEHRVIQKGLDLLETALGRAGASEPEAWDRLVEWFRAFADRNHHAKEEQALFPAMARAGVPVAGGPIGVMLDEHAEARSLVRAMATADAAGRVAAARHYVTLLRQHMDKENDVLFAIADSVLDEASMAAVAAEFSRLGSALGPDADVDAAECALTVIADCFRELAPK